MIKPLYSLINASFFSSKIQCKNIWKKREFCRVNRDLFYTFEYYLELV
jgi:hypothetical protein